MNKKYRLEIHSKYGFYKIVPTPSEEEIDKYYKEEFYSGDFKRFNNSTLEVQLENQDFYEGKWTDMIHNIIEIKNMPVKGMDILDVGCGWATMLLYFKNLGLNCFGFDPAEEAIKYGKSKGLNVIHSGVNNIDLFNGKKFDLITLMNVYEHLRDPLDIISQIKKILKDDGILIIDVPNEFNVFQTVGRDLYNLENWWVYPPRHLNYFSGETLKKLLIGEGFEVKILEASFPLEIFLLFGDNYVGDSKLGKSCHQKRVSFEMNMRKMNKSRELRKFYRSLAENNLGRQVCAYATKKIK